MIQELFLSVVESVNQDDIYQLFSHLNFKEVLKEDVFIEEENYLCSRFKDAKLMIK